ncbi:SDR family NAD(P)-dependent oxidoreductase [Brevibacterium sp. JSBI002]|uniref:SDR family NAD(P)-dependent oxidoreductase n=1 Tax=Brevibacterium sp. JSBI002 TaxID=2886045 RepID=UPI00222FB645|nr:SDR family NAD(P)-dependent oxidoreductase [Brevibacterium sp. JSBI002]UZD62008.1 SDR family NAD(P)-dependent oxidoreductase [Brevibacterium sp. JSBI002]
MKTLNELPAPLPAPGEPQRRRLYSSSFGLACMDAAALIVSWFLVVSLFGRVWGGEFFLLLPMLIIGQLVLGYLLSLYRNRYQLGSDHELRNQGMVAAILFTGTSLAGVVAEYREDIPWLLLALLFAQAIMVFGRQLIRVLRQLRLIPVSGEPVVIVGAGDLGASLVTQMMADPLSPYRPVAIVDDDPRKLRQLIHGVPVRGSTSSIAEVVAASDAAGVIVGISEAPAQVFASLVQRLDSEQIWVRAVPSPLDMLSSDVGISDIRDLDVTDLIGRPAAEPESEQISRLVEGRTVLVTGAGGSIGSELCRIISRHNPSRLIMLDRDESELHALCMSLEGRALMDSPDLVLADIRDFQALDRAFAELKPDIVVHAAALKHLPMLESYPAEGWKTNVHGSLNVLRAAQKHGVGRFVNISTDKAANPSSELGRSKFVAERFTAHFAAATGLPYVSVRFGNVLGSRGSVLISFTDQIRRGGPLTVTHPDVTRFFMTIPEACLLVLRAAALGSSGQTQVLDMGEPVRIVDLAKRLMAVTGRTCPIIYTGLRVGEKLNEELFSPEELDRTSTNGVSWTVDVPPLDPDSVPEPAASLEDIRSCYLSTVDAAEAPSAAAAVGPVDGPGVDAPASTVTDSGELPVIDVDHGTQTLGLSAQGRA